MKFSLLTIVCSLVCWNSTVYASPPSLERVRPAIGQRGTEFEVSLLGAALTGAQDLMFYQPGLESTRIVEISENELKVLVKADRDCALGNYPFRVRTAEGISEMRTLRLTPFPVVAEPKRDSEKNPVALVPVNTTVSGVLASGDVDRYAIKVEQGQRLSAEVEAIRLGATMLDTMLAVYAPDGKQLAAADDTDLYRQDPFLTIIAPVTGEYVVEVRETNYEGDENSLYALHLGTFPRPAFVYPAGGRAGASIEVELGGDCKSNWKMPVALPKKATAGYCLFAEDAEGSSPTGFAFRVSAFDNVLESEPNENPYSVSSRVAHLPTAFNGILAHPGDQDCFAFQAERGKHYRFDALADRLGSSADTLISIRTADGLTLANNDDAGSHDSLIDFFAPHTGEYFLVVADKLGGGAANAIYRVEVTEGSGEVVSFLPRHDRLSQTGQAVSVPQGNRTMMRLGVKRQFIDSQSRFRFEGLPKGVIANSTEIPADVFWVPVVFEASHDAPLHGALVEVPCTTSDQERIIQGKFSQIVDSIGGPADAVYNFVSVDRLAVAVTRPVPFEVRLEQPNASLAEDASLDLVAVVRRDDGFSGPIELSLPFLPGFVEAPSKLIVPGSETKAVFTLKSRLGLPVRDWPICCEASVSLDGRGRSATGEMLPSGEAMTRRSNESLENIRVCSSLISLTTVDSPLQGSFDELAAEQGQLAKLICRVQASGAVPSDLTATLEGLPNRVSAEPVTVSSTAEKVEFTLNLEPTAPVGTFSGLVCQLSGKLHGQDVSYSVGRGGSLKIAQAGRLAVDSTGKPLTPLQALRQRQPEGPKSSSNP